MYIHIYTYTRILYIYIQDLSGSNRMAAAFACTGSNVIMKAEGDEKQEQEEEKEAKNNEGRDGREGKRIISPLERRREGMFSQGERRCERRKQTKLQRGGG